jgi:hypothetical protein
MENKHFYEEFPEFRGHGDYEIVYRSLSDGELVAGGKCPDGFMENGTVAEWKLYSRQYDLQQQRMEAGQQRTPIGTAHVPKWWQQ